MAGASLVRDRLIVRRADPFNAEARISRLVDVVTPTEDFYVRSHFQPPSIDASTWLLRVHGLVARPLTLDLQELVKMPARTMMVTLECAGNGRAFLEPKIEGEQWEHGAVGTAEWTGVLLGDVLQRAGLQSDADAMVFRAADGPFERRLGLDEAEQTPVLLAYAMNGRALTAEHGFPMRVLVPGWYGVASVKWLTEIEVINRPFRSHYQTEKYVYEWTRPDGVSREPVRLMRVRSFVTRPAGGETVGTGELVIGGFAWSGAAPIARVEVSLNDGAWMPARLGRSESRFCWLAWGLTTRVERAGEVRVRSRATDAEGNVQPQRPEWNRLGYGNNAVQDVVLRAL